MATDVNKIVFIFVLILFGFYWGQDANAQETNKKPSTKWLIEKIVTISGSTTSTHIFDYDKKERKQKYTILSQAPNYQSTYITEYSYDEGGNCIKEIVTVVLGQSRTVTSGLMLYDSNNFLIKRSKTTAVDNGRTFTVVEEFENNNKGKPIKTATKTDNASPTIMLYAYDECGNQTKSVVNNYQNETRHEYAKGKDCVLLSSTYLSAGQLTHKFEKEYTSTGKPSKYYFKNLNPRANSDIMNTTTTFTYDGNDNLSKVVLTNTKSGAVLSTSDYSYKKSVINP